MSVDFVLFGDIDEENYKKFMVFNEIVKGSGQGLYLEVIFFSFKLFSDQFFVIFILFGENVG